MIRFLKRAWSLVLRALSRASRVFVIVLAAFAPGMPPPPPPPPQATEQHDQDGQSLKEE